MCAQVANSLGREEPAPQWIKELVGKFDTIRAGDKKTILNAAKELFERIPSKFQPLAERMFSKAFPRVSKNISGSLGESTANKIKGYLQGKLKPLAQTGTFYGFDHRCEESYGAAALRRVKDPSLTLLERGYALCLLAQDPVNKNYFDQAMGLNFNFVITFNASELGLYLYNVVIQPEERGDWFQEVVALQERSAFLRNFGGYFLSIAQLEDGQKVLNRQIESLVKEVGNSFSSSWEMFKVRFGLNTEPPIVLNIAIGYLIDLLPLSHLLESLYSRQEEKGRIAPPKNYKSLMDTPFNRLNLQEEATHWMRLPNLWKEELAQKCIIARAAGRSPFYISKVHGNTKLRDLKNPKRTRENAPLRAVITLFKDRESFTNMVLSAKGGPNLLIPPLQSLFDATLEKIPK